MTQRKKFRDLNLKDAFLFSTALSDSETCRLILEIILGKPIPKLTVHAEHNLLYSLDVRNVRLDIYAQDELEVVYNLEMQQTDNGHLPKRSRYYQGELDLLSLRPGAAFHQLQPTYVIFICTFDPFGENLFRYTFEEICKETSDPLGSETVKIFLNTRGTHTENVPPELIHLLKYIETSDDHYISEVKDFAIEKIHEKIEALKASRELEVKYLTFEEYLKDREEEGEARGLARGLEQGLEKGLEQGNKQTEHRMLQLIECMTLDNRSHELIRLAEEPTFFQEMQKLYNL